jgi:phosphoglycolate phosphatase
MNTIKCVIFDLDGTLLDTSPGITESVLYAAKKLNYPELSEELLLSLIGPPLKDSFMRCYACGETEAEALVAAYREHYREGALLNAKPYDGIKELLTALEGRGIFSAVATSKPQKFSDQILRHFGLDRFFRVIHGADLEGKLKKSELICLCAADVDAACGQCVMVGDTEHDARGAKEAGVPFIGVSYGFGNLAEMRRYPYIGIAEKPFDILKILDEK